MKLKLYDPEGSALSFDDVLLPVIEDKNGVIDNHALVHHLDAQIRAGTITMVPDVDGIRRAVLESAVLDWERRGQEEGVHRFLNDRKGHRLDRRSANIISLDEEKKKGYIASIHRYLFVEGPQAFRSQVDLLLLLDPAESRITLAERSAAAVRDAILEEKEDQAEAS